MVAAPRTELIPQGRAVDPEHPVATRPVRPEPEPERSRLLRESVGTQARSGDKQQQCDRGTEAGIHQE